MLLILLLSQISVLYYCTTALAVATWMVRQRENSDEVRKPKNREVMASSQKRNEAKAQQNKPTSQQATSLFVFALDKHYFYSYFIFTSFKFYSSIDRWLI